MVYPASPSIVACSRLLVINGKENDQFIKKKKKERNTSGSLKSIFQTLIGARLSEFSMSF